MDLAIAKESLRVLSAVCRSWLDFEFKESLWALFFFSAANVYNWCMVEWLARKDDTATGAWLWLEVVMADC